MSRFPVRQPAPRRGRYALGMATPALTGAALAQNRHQGALREFMNQKLAPYLKKALKDMSEVDAEYPLQWLGEHLIHQSFLYENNPDTTGIKERFFYNFDEPHTSSARTHATAAAAVAATAVEHNDTTITGASVAQQLPSTSTTAPAEPLQQLYNGDHAGEGQMAGAEEGYNIREQMDMGQEHHNGEINTDMLNGITAPAPAHEESGAGQVNGDGEGVVDTEMAGTA